MTFKEAFSVGGTSVGIVVPPLTNALAAGIVWPTSRHGSYWDRLVGLGTLLNKI